MSRRGLSDSEMEDILSIDDSVLDEVSRGVLITNRHLPLHWWLRLRCALAPYLQCSLWGGLTSASAGGGASGSGGDSVGSGAFSALLYHWRFGVCRETAEERFVNKDKPTSYHKILAEYFQGIAHFCSFICY